MRRTFILSLFFISGFTGLVYEIIWTRVFGLIFGNTTLAISTVLAAFMLGLALGSRIFGKVGDRLKNHLRSYAFLEIGVGISALLVPGLKGSLEALFSVLHPSLENIPFLFYLIKFAVAFVVMLPATFLMGGTLPVISHAVITNKEKIGLGFGTLYSVNTFGAVNGTFLTAFFLIGWLGVLESILLAVFLNLIIGAAAFGIFRFSTNEDSRPISREAAPVKQKYHFVLLIMAFSGFAALAYEVLWSRILVFFMTNSVYAFAVMLSTFLFGIAIGSGFGGKWADRSKNRIYLLGWLEVAIGLSALLAAILLVKLPGIHEKLLTLGPGTNWWEFNGIRILEAFIVMFLPTFLMGAAFPVAGKILVPDLKRMSDGLGALYFYNTIGGVFGSFLTGFVFISVLGTSATMLIMVLINLLLGIILLGNPKAKFSFRKGLAFAGGGLAALILLINLTPKTVFTAAYASIEKDFPIVDFREGVEGTATVHQSDLPMQQTKRIDVDGLNVAGTSFMLRTLQVLQGNLPQFVRPSAQRVLQIGFGTGQTSHSALLHPVENFTLVEISKDVMDLAGLHFAEINKGVLGNPRFHYTILDGKNFVKYTPEKYDIIMNDANYAVATASASLFTRNHFENCRRKLKEGGILSTWMTTDLDPRDFNIVLKTFQSVFPYSLLWMAPNCINKQVVLMGSTRPIEINFAAVEKQFNDPQIKNDLAAVNINSAYDLLDCLVLDSRGIRDISKDAALNTDDHPILEYSKRAIRARDLCAAQNLAKILYRRPDLKNLLTGFPEDSAASKKIEEHLARNEAASRQFLKGMLAFYQGRPKEGMQILLDGSRLIPESNLASQYFKDMDLVTTRLAVAVQQHPDNPEAQLQLIRQEITEAKYGEALKQLRALENRFPKNPLIYYESARCYLSQSKLDSAKMYLEKSLELKTDLSGSWYFLGEIFRRQNRHEKALQAYQKALQIDPRIYEAFNGSAAVYQSQGNYEEAANLYLQSLAQMEYQPHVTASLGDCYLQLKDYSQAVSYYEKSLGMGNSSVKVLFNLGNAFFLIRQLDRAEKCFRDALALDKSDPEVYYNLGNLYVVRNRFEEAIPFYRQALSFSKKEPDYFNNLAMCYRKLGEEKEAMAVFDEGLKLHPDSPLLVKNAGESHKSTKHE
ncbi:MAG: fused MFS/spermidine synthase [Calditrichia bacterium]